MDGNPICLDQGHIFNEQGHHALAFEGDYPFVVPHPREVLGQLTDAGASLVAQQLLIGLLLLIVRLLQQIELTQTLIPVSFEGVSDEPIGGIDV
jgi:hypothetical protein